MVQQAHVEEVVSDRHRMVQWTGSFIFPSHLPGRRFQCDDLEITAHVDNPVMHHRGPAGGSAQIPRPDDPSFRLDRRHGYMPGEL